MLEKLEEELRRWNETAVPSRKVKADPRSNPELWDHTWTNFDDYPSTVSLSG